MPKVQLSSQSLNIGGDPGGLRPVMVDGAAGGGIRAPRINVNAANIGYAPYDAGNIQQSTMGAVLEGASSTAQTYVDSAFKFQMKQDAVFAEEAAQQLKDRLMSEYYGTPDTPGYSSSVKADASRGYRSYEERVNAAVKETMDGLTPHQRQFALTKLHNLRSSYLQKGATHAASELTAAQEEQKSTAFTSLMDSASTGDINLDEMQRTLSMFAGDADEYDKLNKRVTENALYSVLRLNGAEAAIELAGAMSQIPGVGDGKTIDTFLNTLEGREDEEAREKRAIATFNRTQAAAVRSDNDRHADNFLADNLQLALSSKDGGMLRDVVRTIETNLEGDAAKTKLQQKMTAAIDEGWKNAKLLGAGGTADYKANIMSKIEDMPAYVRDEVTTKLKEMEDADTAAVLKARENELKRENQEKEFKANEIDSQLESLSDIVVQRGIYDPSAEELATALRANPNTTEAQHTRLDRILNGTVNPYEMRELNRVETDWSTYIDRPQLLDNLDISEKKRAELKKRANIDRAKNAGELRKSGYKELQTYYQLQSNPLSGMTKMDGVTGLDEAAAKDNYQDAKVKFDAIMDGYLHPDKNMSAGEAYHKAMTTILGDETLRQGMTGLPKGTLQEGKAFDAPLSYQSDHKAVLNRYPIPQLPSFGDKPANIVEYVQQIGKDVKDGLMGEDPHITAMARINEVYDILNNLANQATSVQELTEIQRLIKNHTAQAMYVDTLMPESHAMYTMWGQAEPVDADTDKVNGQRIRSSNLAAEESDTEKGQQQTEQAGRLQGAMSPTGMMKYEIRPGLGHYGRPVGQSVMGSTSKGATQQNEQGVSPYNKE